MFTVKVYDENHKVIETELFNNLEEAQFYASRYVFNYYIEINNVTYTIDDYEDYSNLLSSIEFF